MTEQERKAIEMALDVLENYVSPFIRHEDRHDNAIQALRQALAQPEWVGLTDEEIHEMIMGMRSKNMGVIMTEEIFRDVEAKLKEKNGG